MLSEKAKSRAQQRFFGMVRSAQKGEMDNPSSEVLDAADSMKVGDVRKFAKTKHKGLPEKKKVEEDTGCNTTKITNKGKKKVNPKKNSVIEDVTLQDANGNDFLEIVDLIKPEPLKKTESIQESTSYKQFMADVQSAKDRQKRKQETRKQKDSSFMDRVKKGVKFYDKKGSGRIKQGKKIYD